MLNALELINKLKGHAVDVPLDLAIFIELLCTTINKELSALSVPKTPFPPVPPPPWPSAAPAPKGGIFASWKCLSVNCPDRLPKESPFALACYTCGGEMSKVPTRATVTLDAPGADIRNITLYDGTV